MPEVAQRIADLGRQPAGPAYGRYVVEMSEVDDPSQLRTEIYWPLR